MFLLFISLIHCKYAIAIKCLQSPNGVFHITRSGEMRRGHHNNSRTRSQCGGTSNFDSLMADFTIHPAKMTIHPSK